MDKSLIDEINSKADIVTVVGHYLNLQKKGRIYVALCPFHDDTHPSLQIDPERNTFHCWVDGNFGNAFSFVMKKENLNFIEAVKKVANIINFNDERLFSKNNYQNSKNKLLFNCINDLNLYYEYALQNSEEGNEALTYLNKRNITNEIIKKFHIGYSIKNSTKTINFLTNKGYSLKTMEDIGIIVTYKETIYDRNNGRITFPIFDDNNQIVGFSARIINNKDSDIKYINSPETKIFSKKNILYNLNNAKSEAKSLGYIFLLEGFMDVIALSKININNTVAIMGINITKSQIFLLKKLNVEVRIFLDGDSAGQEATWKILCSLLENNIDARVVNNETNDDPDDLVNKQNYEYIKKLTNNLLTPFDFGIKHYSKKNNNLSDNKQEEIIDFLLPFIKSIKSTLILDNYIKKLQNITNFNYIAIKNKIESFMKKKNIIVNKNENQTKIINYKKNILESNAALKVIEQKILFYMLLYNNVVEFYKKNIKYFYNDSYRKIANFILDRYEKNDKINVNLLITDIEENNSNDKDDLKKEIISFYKWKQQNKKYLSMPNEQTLINYKNQLDKLRNSKKI